MSLRDRIQIDIATAMRGGDALRRDVLRMAVNAAYNVEKKQGTPLTDDEYLAVLTREVKTRRESVEAFRAAGREDLATKEEAEIEILRDYLPEALGEAELKALVDEGDQGDRCRERPRPRQGHGLALAADARSGRRQGPERDGRRGPRPGRSRRPRCRNPLTSRP